MKMLKKSWRFFLIASAVFWAVICVGIAFFGSLTKPVGIAAAVAAAAAWGIALARFGSIRYETDGSEIRILAGYLIRSVKVIRLENILYESRLLIGGRFLCLRLHTAGGGVTLFCDLNDGF